MLNVILNTRIVNFDACEVGTWETRDIGPVIWFGVAHVKHFLIIR